MLLLSVYDEIISLTETRTFYRHRPSHRSTHLVPDKNILLSVLYMIFLKIHIVFSELI